MSEPLQPSPGDVRHFPFWKLLLPAIGFTALSVALLPRSYAEADDPSIVDFLQHDFLVPFMSVTASRFLGALYRFNHTVPWYALYNWGLLGLCLSLAWRQITSLQLPKTLKTGLIALFSLVFLAFTTRLTFTHTSILLGGLSLLFLGRFLYNALSNDGARAGKRLFWKEPLLYGMLLAASFLTRWEGLKAFAFFVPFVLICVSQGFLAQLASSRITFKEWLSSGRYIVATRKLAGIAGCFLLPLLLTVAVEKSLPVTQEERSFDRFMHAHEDNIGFGISNLRQQGGFLEKLGWSEADYEMYQHWLYIDENTFSTRHMETFSNLTKPMISNLIAKTFQPAEFTRSIAKTLDNAFFKKKQMAFVYLAMFLLALLISPKAGKTKAWLLFGFLLAFSWIMEVFLRFPFRVAGPVFYVSALSLLPLPWLCGSEPRFSIPPLGRAQKSLCFLILILSLVPLGETVYQTCQISEKQKTFLKEYAFLRKITGKNGYLLRESGLVGVKWFDPLTAEVPIIPESSAGWAIFSPPYYERLALRNLSKASDILPWMINRPDAWLLVKAKRIPVIQRYIWEHYRINVSIRPKNHLPGKSRTLLYQIETP